ncbi:peptidase M23B [Shewanella denitrificans OS217]|uniref:Peptidase M23B n=1 Tax=Shewanella denitrificans (strain OS217 / ATCC BAA-1090 / DSM 15013) TaxID=318161 RepID=Q12KD6_SHEDO|nr:peptidoglycan DD-metalloendopeptidase family protein [Shewanella denitrificans]ABE56090.1 peptidase M23B [Shewanella denitrificans OS217]
MAKLITLFKLLPKAHQLALTLLSLFTLVILMLPSEDALASKQTPTNTKANIDFTEDDLLFARSNPSPLALEARQADSVDADMDTFGNQDLLLNSVQAQIRAKKQQLRAADDDQKNVEYFEVVNGDTLGGLFSRAGLSAKDVFDIANLPLAKKNLLKIIPGEEIAITKSPEGELSEVSYRIDKVSTLVISKNDSGYVEKINTKEIEIRSQYVSAKIKSNFWNAAADAGLSANHIMQLANIFAWDVDFALDLRRNDHFSLIVEQEFADGEFLRNGNILAAEFVNQGERHTAVRYSDGEYYSEAGNSLRKAFLRSPVDFKYVSSNFNPRRLHPVTGQVKAHRGVDYVAAVGTPIKSAGRGKVIEAGYNQFNGNYVFIRHNGTYTTKYLHLTKRNVSRGDSVKQGQIIGTLGRTGRVTGAHLHYEFIVNGVHRNPRTVSLPKSDPIARSEKQKFQRLSQDLMAKLKQNQQVQLASN